MTYRSPRRPWAHQAAYPGRLARRPLGKITSDVFSLLCEMGTGKSKMVLDEWGQRVVAVLTVSGPVGLDELRDLVEPRAWAPRAMVVVDELPLLPNGKVDRVTLEELAADA